MNANHSNSEDFDDAPSFYGHTDSEIIALFFKRSENALSAVSLKYGKYISAVAMNVLGNYQEAEECVNDALLQAWENIPPASPKNLGGYMAKLVKNISLNRYRQAHAEKRGGEVSNIYSELDESISGSDNIERNYENKELLAAVNTFLGKLPANKRNIFVLRYWYCMSLSDLAARVGMTENRLAVELFRIRQKLIKYLRKRGY
ncbi:MAG: sigma-70 family RNA polymerase sigma factor [Ruminococcaceae bacterium]|nr:sigma-70 family RNA polymerase sigma factor [Oscillospiraceae bacterium]